jgi:hypothetical protein
VNHVQPKILSLLPWAISAAAIALAVGHLIFPDAQIDAVTVTLLVSAALPWLGQIFRSLEFPGGFKVEYQELERVRHAAAAAGLLPAPPANSPEGDDTLITQHDPNLALIELRLAIERRLRAIASAQGLTPAGPGIGNLLRLPTLRSAITHDQYDVLDDLVSLGNKAAHGARLPPGAQAWAMEVGPPILRSLDQRLTHTEPAVNHGQSGGSR